ncbi:MAG: hypothetical protein LBU32_32395 [Clostridiales bacterium]|jgi:hypothetical protein|nr:hypothetical protein [Clostridiales bacterium]
MVMTITDIDAAAGCASLRCTARTAQSVERRAYLLSLTGSAASDRAMGDASFFISIALRG